MRNKLTTKTKEEVFDFRGKLFTERRKEGIYYIVSFNKDPAITKGKFQDGPIISIDNWRFSLFEFLLEINDPSPSKEKIKKWLDQHTTLSSVDGIYLLDSGERKAVITTKSLVASIAKVLYELVNTNNKSDMFLKRIARSNRLRFEVLSLKNDSSLAAYYSGIYDTLTPETLIPEKAPNHRQHNSYKNALRMSGHFHTLLIEDLLDQGIRPEFITPKELAIWRDKFYKAKSFITKEEFDQKLLKLIEDNNK